MWNNISPVGRAIVKKKTFVAKVRAHKKVKEHPASNNTKVVSNLKEKDLKKTIKSLSDYRRCPEMISCGGETVKNHEKPVTIARGMDFGMCKLITDHLHENLIQILDEFAKDRPVVGCVAWFTDDSIIRSLSKASNVMVIVNDENYATWGGGVVKRQKFNELKGFGNPSFLDYWWNIESPLRFKALQKQWDPVRCFGQRLIIERENKKLKEDGSQTRLKKSFMTPIMHAKFLVISEKRRSFTGRVYYAPRWCLTGSINFTGNSSNNIEQFMFLDCEEWATSLFHTFGNIFLYSGPLDYGPEKC